MISLKQHIRTSYRWGSFGSPDGIYKMVQGPRAYEMALNTWSDWLQVHINKSKTQVFFVSMSPTRDRWQIFLQCIAHCFGHYLYVLCCIDSFVSLLLLQSWGLGWTWWSQLLPRNGTHHQRRVFQKRVEARADASCRSGDLQTVDKGPQRSNPEHNATIGVSQGRAPFHL